MDARAIFGLQFVLSVVVWGLLARWLLSPWLEKKPRHEALFWLTLPHAFRHVGNGLPRPAIAGDSLHDLRAAVQAMMGFRSDPPSDCKLRRQ